ncbi:MAG: murein L,D-transpeptidase catalytic domain family protein [Novosphingobium sp.]|nr:murein L,D-transpeptidase catalytic domain family protein [Novosphingobium sp.]
MKLRRRHFLASVGAGSVGLMAPKAFAAVKSGTTPSLLPQALAALDRHGSRIRNRDLVGIVDFGAPSGLPRFQIVDIANGRVVANRHVAHGRGSDPGNSGWVQKFSNRPGSNASSEGSYMLGDTYYGKHGRSRRLHGLDPANDMAYERAIVIHGADYVSSAMARQSGRIGRSLGCFTVSQRDIDAVLAQLGPGRLLFAAK